ncbi:uncharacterized protein LOC143465517 [Clavelina lepadiformis]|uniref:uncharacterized protein LOC143465517 n=1 Tax=Clavelina lepadiformis TaxID=159417 RepID=UPI0040422DD0
MRKRMSPEGKAYKKRRNATKRKNESDTESSSGMSESSGSNDIRMLLSDLKEKKKILQNFVPSIANKMEIFALTDETFQLRRQDVELDKLSMTEFLKEYPRFSDVNEGILFEREFELMHPEAKSLSLVLDEKFCRAVEKVAQIRLKNITSSNITENKLHTIHMLEKLLPPLNLHRKGYQSAQSHAIFQFAGAGTDPTNFAVHKDPGLTQPFLLAVGNSSQPDQYYIVADFAVIYVGNDVVRALYRLFCSFWVCNISYYPRLAPFYNLLEVLVINKTPVCSVKTVLAAINAVENTACTVD